MAEKWLVIDDSATIQRVIKLAFQDYDVLITEADSVQEALRELASTPSSLVIVDAALAGVQSVHDFSKLPQSSPHSAFVILEGSYDHIDENQFRGAGFRYFLKKPFDAAQLIAITREALGRPIPHRYSDNEKAAAPARARSPFALADEPREAATVTTPTVQFQPQPQNPGKPSRSFMDDFTKTGFGASEGFDLGLDHVTEAKQEEKPEAKAPPRVETAGRPGSFSIDPFESLAFSAEAFQAKPYHPEPDDETSVGAVPSEPLRSSSSFAPGAFELEADTDADFDEGYGGAERETEHPLDDSSYIASPLSGMLEPMLQEEMGKLVRQSVEEYCRKHFAELAREFLMREIDKLSQERSRLLVDK